MSAIYGSIAGLVTPFLLHKALPKVRIEDWTFRLHFRVTSVILIFFSALLSMREYIGDHIKCQPTHDDESNDPVVPQKIIERYCFIQTTFTVPWNYQGSNPRNYYEDKTLGGPPYIVDQSDQVHHAYYQWVPFFLFFQALCFYFPHMMWKSIDNNKIRNLVQQLNIRDLRTDSSERRKDIAKAASYVVSSKGTHGFWSFTYLCCEFGNLAVVLLNIYLTDLFLGRTFSLYGFKVLWFLEQDSELRIDPMATVFPKMTKCLFYMFGPSGNVQRLDALCILPSNILNEKIFVFLWFWFIILALVTLFALIQRIATMLSVKLRLKELKVQVYPAKSQATTILQRMELGDWLLLRILRINLDHATFHTLVEEIYREML